MAPAAQKICKWLKARLKIAEVFFAALDEVRQLLDLRERREPPACRSLSGCSRCASRCICGRSRRAGRPAASQSACRRCCPCRARTSSRGPSRGSFDQHLQGGLIGQHGSALAHGDVVRGIEADRGDVAEGANLPALVALIPEHRSSLRPATDCASWQKAVTASRLKTLPRVWAIMMAFVFGL